MSASRFLFTGHEYVAPVGLYNYRHRAYSPTLGRFLQVDPVAPEMTSENNPYLYCINGPVVGLDPQGLRVVFLCDCKVARWHYVRLRVAFLRAIHRRTPRGELTIGARYLRELADPANPFLVVICVGQGESFAGMPEGEGRRAWININFETQDMEAALVHEAAHAWAFSHRVYGPHHRDPEDPMFRAAERHATAVENQHRWAMGLPQRQTYGEKRTPWGFNVATWP